MDAEEALRPFLGWTEGTAVKEPSWWQSLSQSVRLHLYKHVLDIALRYWPVVQVLKREFRHSLQLLEVGSGNAGLAAFWRGQVVGVDIAFRGVQAPTLARICGSGSALPFADRQFDVVLAVDMLEHVNAQVRPQVVAEMARVARATLIILGPCGAKSEAWEQCLWNRLPKKANQTYRYLREHIENGLPSLEEVAFWLKTACGERDPRFELRSVTNLRVRSALYRLEQTFLGKLLEALLSAVLFPLLRHANRGASYRQMIICRFPELP